MWNRNCSLTLHSIPFTVKVDGEQEIEDNGRDDVFEEEFCASAIWLPIPNTNTSIAIAAIDNNINSITSHYLNDIILVVVL